MWILTLKVLISATATFLRDPVGWDIFNFVNFEKIIYMKLYNRLILTENTKKTKHIFKAPKKSEIVIFPGRILPCKHNAGPILAQHWFNVSFFPEWRLNRAYEERANFHFHDAP